MEKLDTVVAGLGACVMGLCQSCPYGEYGTPRCRTEVMVDAHNVIVRLREKLAEAEPVVHGHWVKLTPDQRNYFTDYTHCCSKCGEWGKKHYKRCRECGAVMDEKMPPEPTPLIRLDLGGRINKRLKQMGVTTVEQLEAMDKHTLHNIPGLGRRSIETIETELRIWKELKEKKDELLER